MDAVRSYGPEPANTKQTQKFWWVDRNQRGMTLLKDFWGKFAKIKEFLRPTKFLVDGAALNIQSAQPKRSRPKYWVPANNVIQFV
jgi:hypothetical protein